ncbi:sulfurtransferase [Novosphingobium sp. Leaf2]|uniref:sulfurtransferase n=1 Tax=Novosphingobium sp. Leaf2 TaxID=1735670 RepID=UPI0006FC02D2|nr:sulfurtransferase [Novosphingobium sp. Leaf2]KQM22091.1 3-mercaptopyruvate sulfurtransferase [Novosphingobium sp. Leaf2]
MVYKTLISVNALRHLLSTGGPVLLLDCAFELGAPDAGIAAYGKGHIPGARYAHLEEDLSSPPDGENGRHPLPARVALAAWLRAQGLRKDQQVVAYDASGGLWAARAWWLLRWMGHAPVAVLDGGLQAWQAAGLPLEKGRAAATASGDFEAGDPLVPAPLGTEQVLANIASPQAQVLDARDPARFAGGPDAIDPVSGHIPGARNRWFRDNLTSDGHFQAPETLAAAFANLLKGAPAILQCGSGVSACHNALAMAVAGLPAGQLYPGSWSAWITDPSRPVATGPA